MTLAEVPWVLRGCLRLEKGYKSEILKSQPTKSFRLTSVERSWGSIGAIVTILCLIYDPFIQGLIQVSERVIYRDNPASLVNVLEKYPYYPGRWNPIYWPFQGNPKSAFDMMTKQMAF